MTEFYTPEGDKQDRAQEDASGSGVPTVLMIGDSISQGYTWPVHDLLEGRVAS